MERDLIIRTLRHCAEASNFADCIECPFYGTEEYPEDVWEDPYADEKCCTEIVMLQAANLLEEGGKR